MCSDYQVRKIKFLLRHPSRYRKLQKLKRSNKEYSIEVFENTQSIFVHVPKSAGVSVCRELYGNLGGGHCSILEYQYLFSEDKFKSYFKFAFVRNPWDRLWSAYSFLRAGGFGEKDKQWYQENLAQFATFEEFVLEWLSESNIKMYPHFISQFDLLMLPTGSAIPLDFLGFFENMDEDFAVVRKHVNPKAELKHLNRTQRSKEETFVDVYSEAMINRVVEVYKKDIDTFHYTFDNEAFKKQLEWRNKLFVTKI